MITNREKEEIFRTFRDNFRFSGPATADNDGLVSVDGDCELLADWVELQVKFKQVSGTFDCSDTRLINLIGSPSIVGGSFLCAGTNIANLKGGPKIVGGNFVCTRTRLHDLLGAPDWVGHNFNCSGTRIKSLNGGPRSVAVSYDCSQTPLESLEGIAGNCKDVVCSETEITSLKGCPKILRTLVCSDTYILNFRDGPEIVTGGLFCNRCYRLNSLIGIAREIGTLSLEKNHNLELLSLLHCKIGSISIYGSNSKRIIDRYATLIEWQPSHK